MYIKLPFLYYNDIAVSNEIIQINMNNFLSNRMNQDNKAEFWLKGINLKFICNNKIVR
jgi:hypothetical protein